MPTVKIDSVLVRNQDGDEQKAISEKDQTWQKAGRKKGKFGLREQKASSPTEYLDSDPPSPCVVCKAMVEVSGIQCDRCSSWTHSPSQDKNCCGLTTAVYKMLAKAPKGVKWFCARCDEDSNDTDPHDIISQHSSKIDTLTDIVRVMQQQNQMILGFLNKDTKIEETLKVHVEEAVANQREKEDRVNNIVLFNVDEREGGGSREEERDHDTKTVKEILKEVQPDLNLDMVGNDNCVRLGKRRDDEGKRPRPIKIVFDDPSPRTNILRKAWRLKDSSKYKKVGISADKTQRERRDDKALRQELTDRKKKGEGVVIYRGKVVTIEEREKLKGTDTEKDDGKDRDSVGKTGGVGKADGRMGGEREGN